MKFTNFRNKLLVAMLGAGLLGVGTADAQVVRPASPVSYRVNSPYQAQAAPAACGNYNSCEAPVDCGCGSGCCDTGGCRLGGRLSDYLHNEKDLSCCDLGEPWTLFGGNCEEPRYNIGGWVSGGYHSESNDLFNNRPDSFNFHQTWLYIEKEAKSECGELAFGFRFDGMYGIDANDTQAFGNEGGRWDNSQAFDRGNGDAYGFALPQAYLEIAKNDWSVKVGHFYTLIGYEVVTAPDNFFYSHAMTMYNSEPFTHTGVIGTYNASDDMTYYAGWTLGWDTGFDQNADGSNFLGGFSKAMGDDVTMTYMTTIGDFGDRGQDGYMHSIVFDVNLTDNVNYVLQSDYLRVGETGEDTFGINQYLFRKLNCKMTLGSRLEWWKADTLTGYAPYGSVLPATGNLSYWNSTTGLNYKASPNLTIRPEYRRDWSEGADYEEGVFGVDFVLTY